MWPYFWALDPGLSEWWLRESCDVTVYPLTRSSAARLRESAERRIEARTNFQHRKRHLKRDQGTLGVSVNTELISTSALMAGAAKTVFQNSD